MPEVTTKDRTPTAQEVAAQMILQSLLADTPEEDRQALSDWASEDVDFPAKFKKICGF